MQKLTNIALPLLLACALASAARASDGTGCPNVRASEVPAHIDHQGEATRCGVGVQVLGITISIGGAKCYQNEIYYPAHQECLGAASPGTACLPETTLPVELSHCECVWIGALGTGVGIPKCSCSPAGTIGTIEDATTTLCHGPS